MAYQSWSVVFGEQPSASKWGILGTNDATFDTYIGGGTNAIQQRVYNQTGSVATGTTILPNDDSIPQSTEGTQFMTKAITPKSATNILEIKATVHCSYSVNETLSIALFQDSTANALAAISENQDNATGMVCLDLTHTMVAGTTSSTTFKIRGGGNGAGTFTFNGASAARRFGGVSASSMIITEYKV
jgi:hypothetical protein